MQLATRLQGLELTVLGTNERLDSKTDYSYTVNVEAGAPTAHATCQSIYGCMYALETFSQLLDMSRGELVHSHVAIADAPDYAWRGLMIDAGRRFVPVDTLEDLLGNFHVCASSIIRSGRGANGEVVDTLETANKSDTGGFPFLPSCNVRVYVCQC